MKPSRIVSQKTNFSAWYESIVEHARLALPGLVKGSFLVLPRAWAIWEQIRDFIDAAYRGLGVQNVAFPAFIAPDAFAREQKHVAGFAPELFLGYKSGSDPRGQSVVLRPTSEILFCHYFKSVLQTHSQLPILINQWCNVFRAEKNTKAFLRTTEFH